MGRALDQLPDPDPDETSDWLDSLSDVVEREGPWRARLLVRRLLAHAGTLDLGLPPLPSTDYLNTIPAAAEPDYPGDEDLERRLLAIVRWNAAAIVSRAILKGRLSEVQLDAFRQEGKPGGLASYPHPRLMPDFWEFPTVSMGLGPLSAIYQARFNRYLHNRGLRDTSEQRVWAFPGDGEMDETEAVGALTLASREGLDNLTFVVNCNLQRLDGPVRGNGKIIQELEAIFTGAGWNVIKVIWSRDWDPLLAQDYEGALVEAMNETVDGEWQRYSVETGAYIREHFFGRDPRLLKMAEHLSDDDLRHLRRGGHDYRKVYAAYFAATQHRGLPTVILAKTVKGWTLGSGAEGRNITHQMKK